VSEPRFIVKDRYDHSWGGRKFYVVDMEKKDYATDQMWLTEEAAQHEADQLNKKNHGISL
jgi:hypothetical protein